jgi:hypothetical protein
MTHKQRFNKTAKQEFEDAIGMKFKYLHVRYDGDEPIIPCRNGEIYPYGKGYIGVVVKGGRKVASAIRKGWEPFGGFYEDNEGEYSEELFILPADMIQEAAKLVRAYRRKLRKDSKMTLAKTIAV